MQEIHKRLCVIFGTGCITAGCNLSKMLGILLQGGGAGLSTGTLPSMCLPVLDDQTRQGQEESIESI